MNKTYLILFLLAIHWMHVCAMPQFSVKQADSLLDDMNNRAYPDFDAAVALSEKLVRFYDSIGDTCQQIHALTRLARNKNKSAQYDLSMSNLILAQKLYDSSTCDSYTQALIWLAFSTLYGNLNETEKSVSYALSAISIYKPDYPDKKSLIRLYMQASGDFSRLEESLNYLDTAYRLAVQYNEAVFEEAALINIGVAYAVNQDYTEAMKYMRRAIPMIKRRNSWSGISAIYNNLAGLTEDKDEALMYIDSALYFANLGENLEEIQLYTENKAYYYSTIQEYELGYSLLWQSIVMKDSLLNIKKIEAVAELEQKYEAEKKAKEIQALKLDKLNIEVNSLRLKRNQNRLLVGSLSLLAVAIFLIFNIIDIHRHRKRLEKKNIEIDNARRLSDELLLNILPAEIAQELKEKGSAEARKFDLVSILFADFKEFSESSENVNPTELLAKINYCFKAFDEIMDKYGVEKIKTIGDAYMAAGGLPVQSKDSVKNTVMAGLEMQKFISERKTEIESIWHFNFEMRVGIHTGPVVAGIVGVKKFQYDVWGDTVNTASRMESNGEIGKVNISGATYNLLKNESNLEFEYRGKIQAKGKGEIDMYFVSLKN